MVFAKTRFADRDPTRRLGGALAAQRVVLDRSWMVLAPCKKRRRMELTLGQQEPLKQIARTRSSTEEPTHYVARTWCLDRGLLRGPFHTYHSSPRPLCAAIGPALEAIVASLVAFGPA